MVWLVRKVGSYFEEPKNRRTEEPKNRRTEELKDGKTEKQKSERAAIGSKSGFQMMVLLLAISGMGFALPRSSKTFSVDSRN